MNKFRPPINTRSTDELLMIAGAPDKWQPQAVELAKAELQLRNIPESEIARVKYLLERVDQLEDLKRAKEAYTVSDFFFKPYMTLFEILVSWELEKDGYFRKARQQRVIRPILILLILMLVIWSII
ncbi:hypothetical protein [Arcticibacter tournemirensis]|uniref:Uncharacterized protein n=1 Tax=Arcticibacter tournemirensis TaxID=699437 RepID=A0A4Q0M496_9SPHI|nr:hypothetical protein [Arcticibacter tournemirensis]RXF67761.1 hypothetical protein EKH83_18220 [Arcticibacter tournemirensis]